MEVFKMTNTKTRKQYIRTLKNKISKANKNLLDVENAMLTFAQKRIIKKQIQKSISEKQEMLFVLRQQL